MLKRRLLFPGKGDELVAEVVLERIANGGFKVAEADRFGRFACRGFHVTERPRHRVEATDNLVSLHPERAAQQYKHQTASKPIGLCSQRFDGFQRVSSLTGFLGEPRVRLRAAMLAQSH